MCRVCFQIKPYRQLSFVSFDFMILQRNLVHQTKHRTHPIILMRPQWNQSVRMVKRETKPKSTFTTHLLYLCILCWVHVYVAAIFFFFFRQTREEKIAHTHIYTYEKVHRMSDTTIYQRTMKSRKKKTMMVKHGDCANQLKYIYGFAIEELVSIINLLCHTFPAGYVH